MKYEDFLNDLLRQTKRRVKLMELGAGAVIFLASLLSLLTLAVILDHALALTPRRWDETVDAMRQCNDVAGDPQNPDVVAYLGWEWTQMGLTPDTHYGHKNVILRDLDDEQIPARPISAGIPAGGEEEDLPGSAAWGLMTGICGKGSHL